MILATTTQSIENEFTQRLAPGETLLAFVYGLRVPPKATSEKILRRGLYVFGAIVLFFMRDKVYVGLTDRRLIVLELTERYARVVAEVSIPRERIEASTHSVGGMYHELQVAAGPQSVRFQCFPSPLGVAGNGQQSRRIHDLLSGTAGPPPLPPSSPPPLPSSSPPPLPREHGHSAL